MNKINFKAMRSFQNLRSLKEGTVFQYPTGAQLYMSIGYIHGIYRIVQLSNGAVHEVHGTPDVMPLPHGTNVSIQVNVDKDC